MSAIEQALVFLTPLLPGAALEIGFTEALRRRAARRVDHKRRTYE